MECFHSRDYQSYWFTETKDSICIKIEFNSQRFGLGHQHGCRFFVLGHQHGRRDVNSIPLKPQQKYASILLQELPESLPYSPRNFIYKVVCVMFDIIFLAMLITFLAFKYATLLLFAANGHCNIAKLVSSTVDSVAFNA